MSIVILGLEIACAQADAAAGILIRSDTIVALVKIYALKKALGAQRKQMLSESIHGALMDVFSLPAGKRFHRFILLDRDDFLFPEDRSDDYVIVELLVFKGRAAETKKALIRELIRRIHDALGIAAEDIEIVILEAPKSDWGIRGTPGDELDLNYKVEL